MTTETTKEPCPLLLDLPQEEFSIYHLGHVTKRMMNAGHGSREPKDFKFFTELSQRLADTCTPLDRKMLREYIDEWFPK